MLLKACFPYNNKPTNSLLLGRKGLIPGWVNSAEQPSIGKPTVLQSWQENILLRMYIVIDTQNNCHFWRFKAHGTCDIPVCRIIIIRSHTLGVYVERVLFFLQIENTNCPSLCLQGWIFFCTKIIGITLHIPNVSPRCFCVVHLWSLSDNRLCSHDVTAAMLEE